MVSRTLNAKCRSREIVIVSFMFLFSTCGWAAPLFQCSFAKGKWDPNQWIMVKSARWDYFGGWIQRDMCIENQTPSGASEDELIDSLAGKTYTSMVLKEQFTGAIEITAAMEFTYRMAPLIVIAPQLGEDKKGRTEYREHYEIVLAYDGVNVWHHNFRDGKPYWKLAAFSHFAVKPNVQHKLKVKISQNRRGKTLLVSVAEHEFGFMDDSLPDKFYAGITGCEGVNRFYDFMVERVKK
jgi:hypothetical protein